MSEERLKKFRSQLQLSKNLARQNQNPQPEDLNSIKKLWQEQEKLMFDSDQPTMEELLLDLKVMESSGSYVGQYIKSLQTNVNTFSPSEYAGKLIDSLIGNGEINWEKLSDMALPIINRAPGISVMLGTFKPASLPVVMPERKKKDPSRNKDEILVKQTAEQVENVVRDEDSVDIKVTHVLDTLRKCFERNESNPIGFYRFILHPTNFTTTVENVFYISFIIRDGLARLDVVDKEFVISPLEPEKERSDGKIKKNQMIFSITMAQWQELVSKYRITQPVIKWHSAVNEI